MSNIKPTITICSSASFYRQVVDVQEELTTMGLKVLIPISAEKMKETGDFDTTKNRSWLTNPDDYHLKTAFIRGHFDKIAHSDAILVLNYEKHGASGYIGGNVLMEMALAFYLKLPIFILNPPDPNSSFLEEIIALEPTILNGVIPSDFAQNVALRLKENNQ